MLSTFKYADVAKDGNWTFLVEERDLTIIEPNDVLTGTKPVPEQKPALADDKPPAEPESESTIEGYTRDTLGELGLGSSWPIPPKILTLILRGCFPLATP